VENIIYKEFCSQKELPESVIKKARALVQKELSITKNKKANKSEQHGDAFEHLAQKYSFFIGKVLFNKKNYCIYMTDNTVEAYFDEVGRMDPRSLFAICDPPRYIKIEAEKKDQPDFFICNNQVARIVDRSHTSKIVLLQANLQAWGKHQFYEKMLYVNVLCDNIKSIDRILKTKPFAKIIDPYMNQKLYAVKEEDWYYLYAVMLEPNAQDAEHEIEYEGTVYKYADVVALYKKPVLDS
jgi:hypothetical protein